MLLMIEVSFDKVVNGSNDIFQGECIGRRFFIKDVAKFKSGLLVTEYKFKVNKWIKKSGKAMDPNKSVPENEVFIWAQQGVPRSEEKNFKIPNLRAFPVFPIGWSGFVFLTKTGFGLMAPTYAGQGTARIMKDQAGNLVVKNSYLKSLMLNSPATKSLGGEVKKGEMKYDEFLKVLETNVKGPKK